jgi:hypothetical protein
MAVDISERELDQQVKVHDERCLGLPVGGTSSTIAPMPTLTEDQRTVLAALMEPAVPAAERTDEALRNRTSLAHHVPRILRELEDLDPPLVENAVDEALGTRVWQATQAAAGLHLR